MIGTIVLSWNRSALLEKTLRSYADTITGSHTIIVVDNCSADNSRQVVESAVAYIPNLEYLFLAENLGGEAINKCIGRVQGDLIQISENDQLFFPGWVDHAYQMFEKFPQLGQLSLHGVMPMDDEIGNPLPGGLKFSRGSLLYQTDGNVGTASILRSELFVKRGLRVHNIPQPTQDDFKFPDDGRLSADVRHLGHFCAWSCKSYIKCLGHQLEQFDSDPDYYRRNYEAKPVKVAGWQQLKDEARSRPPTIRRSVVFSSECIQPERTMQPVGTKSSRLWSMLDGWTAEVEVLDFLYALVRLLKPLRMIETGTWLGFSATAIGSAMRDNGFGSLLSLEINPEAAMVAVERIKRHQVESYVSIHVKNSLEFEMEGHYQMALFDSEIPLRVLEFQRFYECLESGAVVVFHDTAPHHKGSADAVQNLIARGKLEGLFFPTPRGIFVGKVVSLNNATTTPKNA